MSHYARNNPEKVGSDPRTHVPGFGSPVNQGDGPDDRVLCIVCKGSTLADDSTDDCETCGGTGVLYTRKEG